MFWELYQYGRIQEASANADAARSAARTNETDVRQLREIVNRLERQVERLTLTNLALAQVLRDKLGVKQADIEAIVRDIDLRDGKLDGRLELPVQVKRCEACDRVNGPQRHSCLYCGKGLPHESILFPPVVQLARYVPYSLYFPLRNVAVPAVTRSRPIAVRRPPAHTAAASRGDPRHQQPRGLVPLPDRTALDSNCQLPILGTYKSSRTAATMPGLSPLISCQEPRHATLRIPLCRSRGARAHDQHHSGGNAQDHRLDRTSRSGV